MKDPGGPGNTQTGQTAPKGGGLVEKIARLGHLESRQWIETIPDPACVIDIGFTVLMVNTAFTNLLAIENEQAAGRSCYEVFFGSQCGTPACPLVQLSRGGKARLIDDTIKHDSQGVPLACQVASTTVRSADGKLIGIVETCRDMTEHIKSEEQGKDNLHFLITLLDTIPHPVFFKDAEGSFQGCNEVFAEQLLGMPKRDEREDPMDALPSSIEAGLSDVFNREDETLLLNSGTSSYEALLTRADGSERAYIVNKATFSDSAGSIMGIVGVLLDVTELKETREKLLLRNEELTEALDLIQNDLNAAAKTQRALLPTPPLNIKGIEASWHFEPCSAVGGDLLNIFPLDETYVGFYVLDVAGHGVQAALLSVTLSRLLTDAEGGIRSPAEVISLLNIRFQIVPGDAQYFTILYGMIDREQGILSYCSAGHKPALMSSRGGETVSLQAGNKPVGWKLDERFVCYHERLEPGSRVFLFSDGLVEVFNRDRTAVFGRDRLMELVRQSHTESLEPAVKGIVSAVRDWADRPDPEDDVTVLAIEFTGQR